MTVAFMNDAALNDFSMLSARDPNLAVNVNKETSSLFTTKNGVSIFRGSAAKTANNEARTTLLKSLGEAFGLTSGITEKGGKVTFSREFMTKLEKLIGPAFKAKDFGIPSGGGAVSSGKPLTARRVSEILSKTRIYTGANVEFDANLYRDKLDTIKKETGFDKYFALKDPKAQDKALQAMNFDKSCWCRELMLYTKALDFAENFDKYIKVGNEFKAGLEMETEIDGNTDPETIIDNMRKYKDRIQVLDPATGEYRTVNNCSDVAKYIHEKTGAVFHPENFTFEFEKMTDLKGFDRMKAYIVNHFKCLAKNAIDLYYTAKINGKTAVLNNYMQKPGACLEGKLTNLEKFQNEHFPNDNKVDKTTAAELKRIANTGSEEPMHKCIFAELEFMCADEKYDSYEKWEDYAPLVKKHLLNTKHPITKVVAGENGMAKLDSNGAPVVEVVMENGKPAVRNLTAEEIDRDGKLLFNAMFAV